MLMVTLPLSLNPTHLLWIQLLPALPEPPGLVPLYSPPLVDSVFPPSRGPVGQPGPASGAGGHGARLGLRNDSGRLGPLLSMWLVPEQLGSW